jgi:hypothetical protein
LCVWVGYFHPPIHPSIHPSIHTIHPSIHKIHTAHPSTHTHPLPPPSQSTTCVPNSSGERKPRWPHISQVYTGVACWCYCRRPLRFSIYICMLLYCPCARCGYILGVEARAAPGEINQSITPHTHRYHTPQTLNIKTPPPLPPPEYTAQSTGTHIAQRPQQGVRPHCAPPLVVTLLSTPPPAPTAANAPTAAATAAGAGTGAGAAQERLL